MNKSIRIYQFIYINNCIEEVNLRANQGYFLLLRDKELLSRVQNHYFCYNTNLWTALEPFDLFEYEFQFWRGIRYVGIS